MLVTLGTSLQERRQLAHGHVGSLSAAYIMGQHFFDLRFSALVGATPPRTPKTHPRGFAPAKPPNPRTPKPTRGGPPAGILGTFGTRSCDRYHRKLVGRSRRPNRKPLAMEVITMVALIAVAWFACAIIAYATHTLGTLLLWSIPIPVAMVAIVIIMPRLYLDRVNVFTLRMHRRSQAKEQPTAAGREGATEDTSEDEERLDAAA
jgi:hypothetical protein